MNQTINTMLKHSSVRSYSNEIISEEITMTLIKCAQAAASSHFVQAYSIIQVSDITIRNKIAELLDNPQHIIEAPLYFVFVADLSRLCQITQLHGFEMGTLESEALLIATVDTALAAQNMMIAAESLGLGGVYTGVLRNYPEEISRMLNLPDKSFALFGLCLGYPSKVNEVKPRIQVEEILHVNHYDTAKSIKNLIEYDKVMEDYYLLRSSNNKTEKWTDQMAHYFSNTLRPHMNSFLSSKGFKLK
jgi:FMN reductase (NADPH)